MLIPRSLYLVIGAVAAPLGLCVGVMAPVASLASALITVGLVMLMSTAGMLLAADWRAEVESRRARAEVAPLLADWSPAVREQGPAVGTRYVGAFDQDALREVFRGHRFLSTQGRAASLEELAASSALQRAPTHWASTQATYEADQGSASGEETNTGPVLTDNRTNQATWAAYRVGAKKVTVGAGQRVTRQYRALDETSVRLVVNARSNWLASDRVVVRPAAQHTAVVVLANCREAQAPQPAPATEVSSILQTQPPSCRGPPTLEQRRSARRAATAVRRAAPTSDGSSDPVVLDNLGQPVPVCAAEVNVLETYLGGVLEELFPSSKTVSEPERA